MSNAITIEWYTLLNEIMFRKKWNPNHPEIHSSNSCSFSTICVLQQRIRILRNRKTKEEMHFKLLYKEKAFFHLFEEKRNMFLKVLAKAKCTLKVSYVTKKQ